MQRREFITLLGSAAVAWPLAARAENAALPLIGFLSSVSSEVSRSFLDDFRSGLADVGYAEGQTVRIEYRWADGQYEQLAALAEDLVRRQVQVIATVGGTPSALAVHAITKTIPVVSLLGSDPVKLGLTTSLSRPSGNMTGVAQLLSDAEEKRLEVLHELIPDAKTIAYLVNPLQKRLAQLEASDHKLGVSILMLSASNEREIDAAFALIAEQHMAAVIIEADPFFFMRGNQIVSLAARYSVPVIYFLRENVRSGGLISYGTRVTEAFHQIGIYTGRILRGAQPIELPIVQQSEKIELVLNLKTARALGLTVPTSILLRADEVIE